MSANSLLVATPQLRWFKKTQDLGLGFGKYELVLQQYFTDPLGVSGKGEWRTVPTTIATENQQGLTEPPTLEN